MIRQPAYIRIAQNFSSSSANILRFRSNVTGFIDRVEVWVGTGPAGGTALFDVNKNGTSIWAGDQSQRITIPDAGTNHSRDALGIAVTRGDLISVDFDGFTGTANLVGAPVEIMIWLVESPTIKALAAQFDKTDTTLASVTGLTFDLEVKKYRFKAKLHITAHTTGGQKVAVGGTVVALSIIYEILSFDNGSPGSLRITSRETVIGGDAQSAGQASYYTEIKGVIEVDIAGTLTVQFAQASATGTSSVLALSTFEVEEIFEA